MKIPTCFCIKQVILFLSIFFCLATNANAQVNQDSPEKKDTFMIWTGHWQPHGIFIADNGAVITYDTIKKKPIFTMPAARNPMQHTVDEINDTEKQEDDLKAAAKSDENGYKNYPIIKEAIKYYEKLKEETKNAVLKDIDWGDDDHMPSPGLGPTALKNWVLNQCSKVKPDYDDAINYAKSVKGKKDFDLPVPPAADYFDCWACHQKKREEFDKLSEEYAVNFFKEERKRVNNIFTLMRDLQLLGRNTTDLNGHVELGNSWPGAEGQAIDEAFGNSHHPTACSYLSDAPYELNKALHIIIQSGIDRANALWKKYKNDASRLRPIIVVMFAAFRDAQMMGLMKDKDEDDFIDNAGHFIQYLYENWTDKLIKGHDYSKLADLPYMLAMARDAEMCGVGKDFFSQQRNDARFKTLINFNHFKLTIDLDSKVGENQNYDNLHFHSEGYVVAIFDTTDCIHWVPAGLEGGDKNMFLPVKLLVAEKAYTGPHPEYTGTHNFFIPLDLKIHFCENQGNDTMTFPINFLPDPVNGSTWVSSGKTISMAADEYGMSIFKDAKKYKDEIANQGQNNNQQDIEERKKKNQELLDKMTELKAKGLSKQQMMEEMSKLLKQAGSNTNSKSKAVSQVAFPIHFQNKNSVLIDEEFDAKKLNPSMADKIVYGTLKIKLELAPTSN